MLSHVVPIHGQWRVVKVAIARWPKAAPSPSLYLWGNKVIFAYQRLLLDSLREKQQPLQFIKAKRARALL